MGRVHGFCRKFWGKIQQVSTRNVLCIKGQDHPLTSRILAVSKYHDCANDDFDLFTQVSDSGPNGLPYSFTLSGFLGRVGGVHFIIFSYRLRV